MKQHTKEGPLRRIGSAALLLTGLALAPLPAMAELGGAPILASSASPTTIARLAARSAPNAVPKDGTAPVWNVREATLADGTVEREYLDAQGIVFAVAWRGPRRPELSTLLGPSYAAQMAKNARTLRREGQGSRSATSQWDSSFAVRAVSRQRAASGVAWLPAKLPAGVDVDALSIVPGN